MHVFVMGQADYSAVRFDILTGGYKKPLFLPKRRGAFFYLEIFETITKR
jgi:hypothetical protein